MIISAVPQYSTSQMTSDEIYIGGIFSLTGSLRLGGIEREAAFRMAIKQINEDPNILPNHQLIGITKDSGTDAETGVTVAQELIDEGVSGIIGAAASSVTQAIAAGPAKTAKVLQISYSSTAPILSDKSEYPYLVRVVPSDALQTRALAELVDTFGWQVVSILRSSNLYGQSVSRVGDEDSGLTRLGISSIAEEADKLNINVVNNLEIVSDDQIRSHLSTIKRYGSNIILLNTYLDDAIKIFEIANELEMTSQQGYVYFGSDAASQTEIIEASPQVKNAMQGMLGLRPYQPQGDQFNQFLDLWESCDGESPTVYAGCGDRSPNTYVPFSYDATYLLAKVIDKAILEGEVISDGDKLLNLLSTIEHTGVTGPIILNDNGDRELGYSVVNVQDDSFVTIGQWETQSGFSQDHPIVWNGNPDQPNQSIPVARLASSWMLLVLVIIIPAIIWLVRNGIYVLRRDAK